MVRKKYSDYTYRDKEKLYAYRDSSVLRNKKDIRVSAELSEVEFQLTANHLIDLYMDPILVHSFEDIKEIHKYLFSELYEWAGELRKVNISKDEKNFISMQMFENGIMYIDHLIDDFNSNANTPDYIIRKLAIILGNLNHMICIT